MSIKPRQEDISPKNSQKIRMLTLLRIEAFCLKKSRGSLCRKQFTQPDTSIEPKNPGVAGKFSSKVNTFKKRSKNQNFDFSEGHNFLCQKMGRSRELKKS